MSVETPRPRVPSFADVREDVAGIMGRAVYATMTTVDRKGRPRSRILIVVWQLELEVPIGWLATFKTPVKTAHLAHNPHVTTSYLTPHPDAAYLDSVASWIDDAEVREMVWSLYRDGSPPGVGYDPGRYWAGPHAPDFHVLRLDPWRVQVLPARELARGLPSRIWRRDVQSRP
jgi:general stress protein 26